MAVIEWSEDFSVKVKEIDEQHKGLFRLINELDGAITQGKTQDVIGTTVHNLMRYAQDHFATEEKYMVRFRFPGYDEHKAEHNKFSAKALELNGRLEAGVYVMSSEIVRFIKEWITDHVLGTDKKYSQCFNENGLV